MKASLRLEAAQLQDEGEWLNSFEAAKLARIFKKDGVTPSAATIRNLANERRLPFYKPFGRLLFRRSELNQFIERTRQEAISGYYSVRR